MLISIGLIFPAAESVFCGKGFNCYRLILFPQDAKAKINHCMKSVSWREVIELDESFTAKNKFTSK